jgi:hypothetical protein
MSIYIETWGYLRADQDGAGIGRADEGLTTCISKGRGCAPEGERTKGWDDPESGAVGQGGGHEECVKWNSKMKDLFT